MVRVWLGLVTLCLLACDVGTAGAQWVRNGARVAETGEVGEAIPDGAGGAFFVWQGGSAWPESSKVYAQRLTSDGTAAAGWPAHGLPLCSSPGLQQYPRAVSDGAGGIVVAWIDYRDVSRGAVYAQRVTAAGALAAGWPAEGAPVCALPGDRQNIAMVPDGSGGAMVAWEEAGPDSTDIAVQRVLASGSVAWVAGGVGVAMGSRYRRRPVMAPDDSGGAYVFWIPCWRWGWYTGIRGQRLDPGGNRLWGDDGVVATDIGEGLFFSLAPLASDGQGGVRVVWSDSRSGAVVHSVYLQHFDRLGTAAHTANGIRVCVGSGNQFDVDVAPDGQGGAVLSWQGSPAAAGPTIAGPAWGAQVSGIPLAGAAARAVRQARPSLLAGSDATIVAQRLDVNDDLLWNPLGVAVCTAAGGRGSPVPVSDGTGGAFVVWGDERDADSTRTVTDVYVQRIDASGAPQWTPDGVALTAPTAYTGYPIIAGEGASAIVAWDAATFEPYVSLGVYAMRLLASGPVPVQVSLASAVATPTSVRLRWYLGGAARPVASLYRREQTSDWSRLGNLVPDGAGYLEYEDRAVVPGARYAYRLGFAAGTGEEYAAETWIEVPRAPEFALAGARPNPATGPLAVAFSLASNATATLELLSVNGSRVMTREVGSLGAGNHLVRLDEGARVPAGLYWLRLSQGGRSAVARVVVTP